MNMRFLSSILLLFTIVACSGNQEPPHGSGAQGARAANGAAQQEDTQQDANAAAACTGKPIPAHECVGGAPAPRCNTIAGESRWQIDCVTTGPNAPLDTRGVSPCDAQQCGSEPAWDASDCLHGFVGPASCESIDRAACTWRRRCRPKPCSVGEGTCNVLHEERLGARCSGEVPCPSGFGCSTIAVDIGHGVGPVCVADPPCSAITCAPGTTCMVLESYPSQIVCEKL